MCVRQYGIGEWRVAVQTVHTPPCVTHLSRVMYVVVSLLLSCLCVLQTYLEQNEGPGLQHLALKTNDIIHTVGEMAKRSQYGGFEFMPRPSEGYYGRVAHKVVRREGGGREAGMTDAIRRNACVQSCRAVWCVVEGGQSCRQSRAQFKRIQTNSCAPVCAPACAFLLLLLLQGTDMTPDQIAACERHGILIDKDDQGILLQIFTKPLGDR